MSVGVLTASTLVGIAGTALGGALGAAAASGQIPAVGEVLFLFESTLSFT